MLILDLWGISFHPVVFVGLGNDLLFNFIVGHCGEIQNTLLIICDSLRSSSHYIVGYLLPNTRHYCGILFPYAANSQY